MSGIKGYSTQKKVTSSISGYTDKQTKDVSEFVTISESFNGKVLADVKTTGAFRITDSLAAAASSTTRVILCTAHGGLPGDFVRFELATANPYFEAGILSVPDANTIILDTELLVTPTTSDAFFILRHITQRMDASGGQIVIATQGPTQFVLNGTDTVVSQDTSVPANSRPLPTQYLNSLGVRTNLATETTITANGVLLGSVTETAPGTDTASSGLNGRLQRVSQRLTSLIALVPASLGSKADASSFAVTWSTENQGLVGSLTEAAPASDTASSGLNGRLQRVAQRLTSLIALVPASLAQKTMANSFAVTLASDQSTLAVNQVQPTTGTNSSVAASTSSVTVLASNAARRGASVYNDSTSNLYLSLSAAASATSFAVFMLPGAYFELPNTRCYTGIITGIWVSATGNARVSEIT